MAKKSFMKTEITLNAFSFRAQIPKHRIDDKSGAKENQKLIFTICFWLISDTNVNLKTIF